MKKYSTVVFDLDGTLLNTLEDLADAVNYVLRKFGWEEHTIYDNYAPVFSHPDFTVGYGFTPYHAIGSLTYAFAITAGREFHPAPKNFLIFTMPL